MTLTAAHTEELYEQADRQHEQVDICNDEFQTVLAEAINADDGEPDEQWKKMVGAREGTRLAHGGNVLKELRGAGTVYDWRDSPWTPANGGWINLKLFVQHIPVVRNIDGIGDMVTLRNVLVSQGLMVQCCTDREGNVGLFTPFNVLCYQARGANQVSCGCEHMHATTNEPWTQRQLRAMAWVIQLCDEKHDVKRTRGRLGSGNGVVRVHEEGQVWHEEVADAAGHHDRSDPWGNTPHDVVIDHWEYVQHCILFFREHGHFVGA